MANNTYIEKKRQILCTWREYVRREKNAVNVIGAIARRTMRIEVFRRIRLAAREKWLDKDAERICSNMFKIMNQANLRNTIVRWRVATLIHAKKELKDAEEHQVATLEKHAVQ